MSSKVLLQNGHVMKKSCTFSAISDLAFAVVDVIVLHRLLVSYFGDGVVDQLGIFRVCTFL